MSDEKYTAGNGRYELEVGRWLQGQTVRHWDNVEREWSFSEQYVCYNGYEAACMHAEDKLGVRVDQDPPEYVQADQAEEEAEDGLRFGIG